MGSRHRAYEETGILGFIRHAHTARTHLRIHPFIHSSAFISCTQSITQQSSTHLTRSLGIRSARHSAAHSVHHTNIPEGILARGGGPSLHWYVYAFMKWVTTSPADVSFSLSIAFTPLPHFHFLLHAHTHTHTIAVPVFIVGMMRSGSSLLEHILDAHSGATHVHTYTHTNILSHTCMHTYIHTYINSENPHTRTYTRTHKHARTYARTDITGIGEDSLFNGVLPKVRDSIVQASIALALIPP